uniref:hypothetical protein n=1 Tax=Candidatus Stercorousia sp. TaxID=3048886 RepID=UPI004024BF2B
MENFLEYAPIIIVVVAYLFKNKVFITPVQLKEEHSKIIAEIEAKYLTLIAHKEFEKRINDNFKAIEQRFDDSSKRFDHIDDSLDRIKDILINHSH